MLCVVASALAIAFAWAAPARAETPPPHTVDHVRVASYDGVELDGWIVRPANVAPGAKLPIVLWSAPYFGQCDYYPFPQNDPPPRCHYATGDDPELWDNSTLSEAVPVNFLVRNGYAVAIFNVRGTGNSGGCFSWFGPQEQGDQKVLVDWLGARPWSNGSVGMMGLSYHGTTPWEAAVQNPKALKTIVVAGMIGDAYTFSHTPQGATGPATIGVFDGNFAIRTTLSPPIAGSATHWTIEHFPVVPERFCSDLTRFLTTDMRGLATDFRDPLFYSVRQFIHRFPQIKASVLLTHGFQDLWFSGHRFQDDPVWRTLTAPKRMLVGQWGHSFPNFNTFRPEWAMADWNARLLPWLDYWLKGVGTAPRVGVVDYQDGSGAWRASSSWPPADARQEVLYLTDGRLSPTPGIGSASFRSYPQPEKIAAPAHLLCEANSLSDVLGRGGLSFLTPPVTARTLVAGNPFAYLRLESDLRGGQVGLHLLDVAPNFRCDGGFATGARAIATGAADLRFHDGNYHGRDFAVNEPTHVRVDITNLAEVLEPGHRLALVVSYGDYLEHVSQPFFPRITVHADGGARGSQLVVPLVQGSFGGAAPTLAYPPRPFVP